MYNEERKRSFIRFKQDTTELANNIISCFNDAEIFEEKYEKDLCDWTAPEIVGYLKYINTTKASTLTVLVNMLRIYTDWCLSNSLVQDHQNHYYEVTQEIIDSCIDAVSLADGILTRDFLLQKLEYAYNAADKFVLLGSFEGIRTMDFPVIRISDIKGNSLVLKKRTIQISDELAEIAAEANTETVYMSPIRRLKIDLESSEYVLKNKADADEDETGLHFIATFDDTEEAQRVRELYKDGRLKKFSFAYDVLDQSSVTLENGTKANELRELDIHEISCVCVPANDTAEVIDVKAGRRNSKSDEDKIKQAITLLQSVVDTEEEPKGEDEPKANPAGEEPKASNPERDALLKYIKTLWIKEEDK